MACSYEQRLTVKVMRVLVVHDRALDQISPALESGGYRVVRAIGPRDDLVGHAKILGPELIVFDVTAPDNDLLAQVRDLNAHCPSPIVIFTDEADAQVIRQAITAGASAYIVDGLQVNRLQAVLNVAIARFQDTQSLRDELADARRVLADRKKIDRAKGILMQRRGIGEDEAYRTLRKLAMDRNQRIGEVADSVITAAELLG